MKKFVTIGEPLVVYASDDIDVPLNAATHFTRFPAGAELNVTIGLIKQGFVGYYMSALGADSNGHFLRAALEKQGISTAYIAENSQAKTGIYFKDRVTKGDPTIEYARANSAASQLKLSELPAIDFTDVGVLHLTGISGAISTQMFKNVEQLIFEAHKAGVLVTFDPNIRPALWSSQEKMIGSLNHLAAQCDIILPGLGEGYLLTGYKGANEIANFYLNLATPNLLLLKVVVQVHLQKITRVKSIKQLRIMLNELSIQSELVMVLRLVLFPAFSMNNLWNYV